MNETRDSSPALTLGCWLGGFLLLILGGLGLLYFFTFDTRYAPGYSEGKFRSIKAEDSEQLVLSLLGPPFSTNSTKPFVAWIYSADNQSGFPRSGEGKGTYTIIRYEAGGRVVSVDGRVQTSASSVAFGPGLNYLKLTPAQISQLIGSSPDVVKQKFGPPAASYEDKSVKYLRYSQSPSSANYHLRAIGLDERGKVVKILDQIYWD